MNFLLVPHWITVTHALTRETLARQWQATVWTHWLRRFYPNVYWAHPEFWTLGDFLAHEDEEEKDA